MLDSTNRDVSIAGVSLRHAFCRRHVSQEGTLDAKDERAPLTNALVVRQGLTCMSLRQQQSSHQD